MFLLIGCPPIFNTMKIRIKVIFSFVFITLVFGIISYFWLGQAAQKSLGESIGQSAVTLGQETLDKIDMIIYGYMDRWRAYLYNAETRELLEKSNSDFQKIAEPEAYIAQKDQEWISAKPEEITPFMKGLIDNNLSQKLRERTRYYEEREGHVVFSEVFITNSYGANLAQTGKTTDYYQADEEWWQQAKKNGLYIEDVSYEESSQVYSINICFSINDEKGDFFGVIKISLSLQEITNTIKELELAAKSTGEGFYGYSLPETAHFILATQEGKLIYSTKQFNFGEDINGSILSKFFEDDAAKHQDYVLTFDERTQPIREELLANAHSRGYKDFPGVGWYFITQYEASDIFKPVYELRSYLILIILLTMLVFALLGYHIASIIFKPIKKLQDGMAVVEKGNLDFRVGTKARDEIGQLAQSFDKMTLAIQKSRAEVDKKVEEQTKEIRNANEKLTDQQTALLNVLDDIEKEKENVTKEKDKINIIVQSIGDGVFVIDDRYEIILFNKMASEISGFSSEESLGRRYDQVLKFIYEKDGKVNDKFIQEAMGRGEIVTMANHTLLITKEGKKVSVADSAAPFKDKNGKIIGCVVVFRDVTREREIDKIKSDFVSIASHQLRTPLTGIQWTMERIMKTEKPSKKIRGYFEDVRASARRLASLVNDLLNVSRLEEGNIAVMPEEIELVKFFSDRLGDYKSLAEKKEIDLSFKKHPAKFLISTDHNLLQNIFQSLVSNAIEYTNQGGRVQLSLEKKEDNFIFSISDNGIGIPKEAWPTIFNKFTRAENAKTYKPSGSGLGLYLAKAAVVTLDGKIWFETEENKGTTFFVELPIQSKSKAGMKGFV